MDQTGDLQDGARAEAADWFARLRSLPVSRETLEGFFAWRRAPAHAEAFAAVERLWAQAGELEDDSTIAALTAEAYRRGARQNRARGWARLVAVAAVVIILGALGTVLAWDRGGQAYATRVGEQRVVTLDDGSRITLDTDTRLVARLGRHARDIALDHGRAYFAVAHDAARPFTVHAGGTAVLATGTRFDVSRRGAVTGVTLVEGKVEVSAPQTRPTPLVSGQQWIREAERAPVVHKVEPRAATAWTDGRIVLDGVALAAALDQVNRYTTRPIRLASASHAGDHVSGSFRTGDVASFAVAVQALLPLDAVRQADGSIRLVDRPPGAPEKTPPAR